MKKGLYYFAIISVFLCMVMILSSCGRESVEGTWYYICEDPESSELNITFHSDGTFTEDTGETGTYEYLDDETINISTEDYDASFYFSDFDGETVLKDEELDEPYWCKTIEGAISIAEKRGEEYGEYGDDSIVPMTFEEAKEVGGLCIKKEDDYYPLESFSPTYKRVPNHVENHLEDQCYKNYDGEKINGQDIVDASGIFIIDETSDPNGAKIMLKDSDSELIELTSIEEDGLPIVHLTGNDYYVAGGLIEYDVEDDWFGFYDYESDFDYNGMIETINGKKPEDMVNTDAALSWVRFCNERISLFDKTSHEEYYNEAKKDHAELIKDKNLVSTYAASSSFLYRLDGEDPLTLKCKDNSSSVDSYQIESPSQVYHAYNVPSDPFNISDKVLKLDYTPTENGYYIVNTDKLEKGLYLIGEFLVEFE